MAKVSLSHPASLSTFRSAEQYPVVTSLYARCTLECFKNFKSLYPGGLEMKFGMEGARLGNTLIKAGLGVNALPLNNVYIIFYFLRKKDISRS